jgi:hypothetical protein
VTTEHDRRAARRRISKRTVRAIAWVAGGAAFLTPLGALAASPRPAVDRADPPRPRVVVRRITRRVIIVKPAEPQAPTIRYVGGGSSSASTSSSSGGAVAPPPAPPATSTGGS